MHKEVVAILNQPDIVSVLAAEGATVVGNSPQAFGKEIRDDLVKWAKVIKEANISF
jgi:tripartite-type tricarboxylate transporter receptor subunit TctC